MFVFVFLRFRGFWPYISAVCWILLGLFTTAQAAKCPSRCQCYDPREIHCQHAFLFDRELPAAIEVTIVGRKFDREFLVGLLRGRLLEYLHLVDPDCGVITEAAADIRRFREDGGFVTIEGHCHEQKGWLFSVLEASKYLLF